MSPALASHEPRTLEQAQAEKIARLESWLKKIRDEGRTADPCDRCNRLRNFAHAALSGWEVL